MPCYKAHPRSCCAALHDAFFLPVQPVPVFNPMTLRSHCKIPRREGGGDGNLKTRDGMALALRPCWPPPPGRKGTVCLFQGRAEFIEKYFETVRDLRARGFAVATLDGGAGREVPSECCATSARAMFRASRSIRSTSKSFIHEVVLPDCPPPSVCARPLHGGDHSAARGLRWAPGGSIAWCCWRP